MSSQHLSLGDGKPFLPPAVHVDRQSLDFYADEPASHTQVLWLCNPYPYPMKFRVGGSQRLTFPTTGGIVEPSQKIEIKVRHNAVERCNVGRIEPIRIDTEIRVASNRRVACSKELTAILHVSRPVDQRVPPQEEMDAEEGPSRGVASVAARGAAAAPASPGNPHLLVWLTGLVCIIGLMLPTHKLDTNDYPHYLQLNYQLKLVFAYALGMITIVVLRP